MNCVFGPYKITSSSFPGIEGTTFVDTDKTRRIAIVSSCDSAITAPCDGAIAVSQTVCEESNCNIRWYECPSVLGRTYTIFPTPCGVTITSFEDGLLSLNGCSATNFGSSTFCFGRIYTAAGEFKSESSQVVSFELDGHTFVVEGVSGECNEFLDCGSCSQFDNEEVAAFAALPAPPPEVADEEIEEEAAPDDETVPETEIIPSENRTVWHNIPAIDTGPGTKCDAPVNVSGAAGACESSDSPAVATLPSGHTIIAYEDRSVTGLALIRVAILKSSVNKNIVYYRRLSKGTLINDPEKEKQTFEVFEEMSIKTDTDDNPVTNLTIGFLSGPLIGAKQQTPTCKSNCLYMVEKVERIVETNNRIKHVISFTPNIPAVFPDQNDISDVSWFLADDAGGNVPPSSSNVITFLSENLTAHKFPADDTGVQVPVANPSIAVAKNNQMISSEQSIFLVYQAFEENQWRVYLRQIVLGGDFDDPPTYTAPYLFTEQTPVVIEAFAAGAVTAFATTTIFDDTFGHYLTENETLESTDEWNLIETPSDSIDDTQSATYVDQSMLLCKNRNPVFPLIGCSSDNENATCRLEFGTNPQQIDLEPVLLESPRIFSFPREETTLILILDNPLRASGDVRINLTATIENDGENNNNVRIRAGEQILGNAKFRALTFNCESETSTSITVSSSNWNNILNETQITIESTGFNLFCIPFNWIQMTIEYDGIVSSGVPLFCDTTGAGSLKPWMKSFYSSTISAENADGDGYLRTKLSVKFSIERDQDDFYPEAWFLMGRSSSTSDVSDGWRIRVERHNGPAIFGNDGFVGHGFTGSHCGGLFSCNNNCFVISIYNGWNTQAGVWTTRSVQTGTRNDLFLRQLKVCVDTVDGAGDYLVSGWNTLSVETYLRGRHRVFKVVLNNDNNVDYELVEFREIDESTFNSTSQNDSDPIAFGKYYGFGFINHAVPTRSSIDQVTLTAPDEVDESKHIFYEDFLDYNWHQMLGSPSLNPSVGLPPLRYLLQVANEPNTGWQQRGYEYAHLLLCNRGLDTRYPVTPGFNTWRDLGNNINSYDHLSLGLNEICTTEIGTTSSLWSILKVKVPAELRRNASSPFNPIFDTSFYTAFSHGDYVEGNGEQWGDIWFLLRQQEVTSAWHTGWRLRVRYYLASGVTTYNLQVYDEDTSSGSPNDIPVDSITISPAVLNTQLFVHQPNPPTGSPAAFREDVIPYFRVDITTDTTETKIELYKATKTQAATGTQPTDLVFNLVHSFTGLAKKHFGTYYGLALMSGASINDNIDSTRDWRSQPIVDYLQIRSFDDNPTSPTGSCCRAKGGCQDTKENECISPDVWDASELCATRDCTVDFIFGASCRESDNECLRSTESGVPSDFGNFVGGEWIAGKNCIFGDADYRNCTQDAGSCCKPDGSCLDGDIEAVCESFWGLIFDDDPEDGHWRRDVFCVDRLGCDSPPSSTGACCINSYEGCLAERTSSQCTVLGGTYLGDGTDCQLCVGACCHSGDGSCTDTYQYDCLANLTTPLWLGNGTTCAGESGSSCLDTTGGCCFTDGQCGIVPEEVCVDFFSGDWDVDRDCIPNPCNQPFGACCDPLTGECTSLIESDCENLGKTFIGGDCSDTNCPQPTGACCIGTTCSQKTQSSCVAADGVYFGDNTQCLPDQCTLEDPYTARSVDYKPEDLWVIQTGDNTFATRVLYHMREENIFSTLQIGGEVGNEIDFMFVIEHFRLANTALDKIVRAVAGLSSNMISRGLDTRFGFIFHGRSIDTPPEPDIRILCDCAQTLPFQITGSYMADGLQESATCKSGENPIEGSNEDGFTRNIDYLIRALSCWGITINISQTGARSLFPAIQFAIEDSQFSWRSTAAKFIFSASWRTPGECDCGSFTDDKELAKNSLIDNGVVLIPVVNPIASNLGILEIAEASGWTLGSFDISGDFDAIFEQVVNAIDATFRIGHATIVERANEGTEATFLKQGEVIITYDGDLSDLWTFNKIDFEFSGGHAPFPGTATKQLSNFPFPLASGKIYGIDAVHIQGLPNNWVTFGQEGPLHFDHPKVGTRSSAVADPVLVAANSTRPKVFVNNRNQVIVAYESYESGSAQINIKGTGDFYQNSITGPKGSRLQRFYAPSEFSFNHAITLDGEGVNQLCDFVVDSSDITHITWQSNRDGEWEIYYANSFNLFEPIKLTKSDSRSSMPSIDVEENGNIFVVYHDNRFGPFEVMLATKTEERIPFLLEQDAYMASMRHNYIHYTNTMPVAIQSPTEETFVQNTQLWGSKVSTDPGNDNENYVYKLSLSTGQPSEGGDSRLGMSHIAFHPDGRMYGIVVTEDNSGPEAWQGQDEATLYLISDFGETGEPEITQTPTIIGEIDLSGWDELLNGRQTGRIMDIDFDSFGRLWLYMWNRARTSRRKGSFKWIDVMDLSVKAESKEFEIGASDSGLLVFGDTAFAIDNNNNFYWGGGFTTSNATIITSTYPTFTNDASDPNGPDVPIFDLVTVIVGLVDERDNSIMSISSMAFNELDVLFMVSENNDLFSYSLTGTLANFLAPLSTDSQETTGPFPVGDTSSIAFLQTATAVSSAIGGFFHIFMEFYDNFAMAGEPFLTIDSRNNLEAFVSEGLDDPYNPYEVLGMDARGIFLEGEQTGIVFFDATQFRPGFPTKSIPYSFEPNQAYFPKVFTISSDNAVIETTKQNASFSCSKCSRFGTNNFDSSGCSYSFVVTNTSGEDRLYNFQVDFYADIGKQSIVRRFELTPGNTDLQFVEVDNQSGISKWGSAGLLITVDDAAFIQVYPSLDTTTGFLCGINYTIQVNQCFSTTESECSDFIVLTSSNWDALEVQGSELISTDSTPLATQQSGVFNLRPIAIGLDMHNIGGKIALAYRTENNNLAYVTYDGVTTWTNDIIAPDLTNGVAGYVSLGTSQGRAAVVFTTNGAARDWPDLVPVDAILPIVPRGGIFPPPTVESSPVVNVHLRSRIFNGTNWIDGMIFANTVASRPWRYITIFDETDPLSATTPQPSLEFQQYHIGSTQRPSVIQSFGDEDFIGDFCDTATINSRPHTLFWRSNNLYLGIRTSGPDDSSVLAKVWSLSLVDEDLSFSVGTTSPIQWESPGRPAIVGLDSGLVAVAYIKQDGAVTASPLSIDATQRRLIFRTFDGLTWTDVNTGVGRDNYNKSVAMEIIGGQPYIAYTINKGSGRCDLKVAIFDGAEFRHETVAENISVQDPQVDVIEFQSSAVITISASPLIIYLQRKTSLSSIDEISSRFFCECSSKIFPDGMVHLAEVARWEASAHGHSDTRVTDSVQNSLRPKIATRSTGTAIIVWEDNNCDTPPCIKAASFRNTNQDQLRSSGTGSWFDFDFNTHGQQPDLALDIYDRAITAYERPIPPSAEGFFGSMSTKEELPSNQVFSRICDFDSEQVPGLSGLQAGECDISELEANIITVDEFISGNIVKKIRVKDEFIQYYTYNASGRLASVVSACEITLEIHGTPEIVAVRLKNENQTTFGAWCPWSPQIGDFMMEKRHKLSANTGIKEVCVQAMTYVGVTVQFCVPIIADYETVIFETRFYKNTFDDPKSFQALSSGEFSNDDSELEELPLSSGLAVANLAPQIDPLIVAPSEIIVLVEIIPNKEPEESIVSINYDVLQQGTDDTPGLIAIKGKNDDGKTTFRGFFTIKREDKVMNIDGLARVSPKFPQICDEGGGGDPESTNLYNPNQFNLISRETEVEITEETDVLESFRQDVSGRVGVDIDIRSQEDPYFVFGDPNYSLRQRDGERAGVPLNVPADIFGLGLGLAPTDLCVDVICPPGLRCDSATGNCVADAASG